jgi:3-isopropylmalate/(R)-2-methylmalate dehydratase small subunit
MATKNKPIKRITGYAMPFKEDNADTDLIAPKPALYALTWQEVGEFLFSERKANPSAVLNNPRYANARILLVGNNFGCGSSREHAPQAIKQYYDAVIAVELPNGKAPYANIFHENSDEIGLPVIWTSRESMGGLVTAVEKFPPTIIKIDLISKKISYVPSFDNRSFDFNMTEDARQRLLRGEIGEGDAMASQEDRIKEFASKQPSVKGY